MSDLIEMVEQERDEWREEAWRCYVESGADPDGADARHLNPGEAIRAVRELRADYDAACDELAQLKQSVETLREAVEDTLCDDEPCSRCDHLRRALASLDEQEAE